MTQRRRGRARPGRVVAIPFIALVVIACGSAAAPRDLAPIGGTSGGLPAATAAPVSADDQGGQTGGSGGGGSTGGGAGGPVLDAVRPDLFVIKTGTLGLEVDDVDAAVAAAASVITGLGGYVSGSSQSGSGPQISASITYRVPSDRWEDALVALRDLATNVVAEQTQTDDVSGQVVDLAARVRNLEATERAIQAVMDRATTIDEILQVQAELTKVRGEIEAAASERAHLVEQATFSTLTVRFEPVPEPDPSPTPSPTAVAAAFDPGAEAGRATETLVGLLQRLATVGIWFGIVWLPILLVLGLVALAAWALVRRRLPPVEPFQPGG